MATVDDLERAYWAQYLGKQGSLNSLRYEGYGQLAGMSTGTVNDRERAYLISVLGLSAAVGAATSLDDLRKAHRIQSLSNEALTDTAIDLDYKFWQVGFGPTVTVQFRDQKTEGTAAAQTKTLVGLGMGPASANRHIIVHWSCTSTVQPPSITLGGVGPSDVTYVALGGTQQAGIYIFPMPTGTTANLVVDAGVGNTIADLIAYSYSSDKVTVVRSYNYAQVAAGAVSISTTVANTFWAPNDFVHGTCRISGAAAGFNAITPLAWQSSFFLNNKQSITGDVYGVANSPTLVTVDIAGTTDLPSILIAARLRVS